MVYQGDDWAYFNFETTRVKVCDKEMDSHAVCAYLRHHNDLDADVPHDNTKGCTTHIMSSKQAYKYITVCDSVWGPDWCHQPVVYMRWHTCRGTQATGQGCAGSLPNKGPGSRRMLSRARSRSSGAPASKGSIDCRPGRDAARPGPNIW
ncbi:hypothetical protein [Streptomyces sp. NPDC059278]|uniref:hypothetical protein n=1 Tax=Streptomyces sp. NPDC059278 TaxID=3346801 RepID=UPI0036D0E35B